MLQNVCLLMALVSRGFGAGDRQHEWLPATFVDTVHATIALKRIEPSITTVYLPYARGRPGENLLLWCQAPDTAGTAAARHFNSCRFTRGNAGPVTGASMSVDLTGAGPDKSSPLMYRACP